LIIERFENRAAGKFSTLVAATPEIGKRFEPINPRTVVINNYPLLNELHSSTPSPWQKRLPGIAYVGVITERRGIFQMVEAMQHVPAQLNATLELVGPFETLELREQVMQLPGWNRVNESGILEREQVASLLGKVRAGLTTLLPTTAYSTSQATKTFEYMSAGIPAIISNFPAWKHLEDMGCCIQVDPYDTRAIANAITFLITQPAAAEMGRRGRRAIEQYYNWETQVPKLVELYEKLLN
jgi:glycosyltransferase involved in cell wall biosynthesis